MRGALPGLLQALTGRPHTLIHLQPLSGGCINDAWRVETASGVYFLKTQDADRLSLFEAEADGLRALAQTGALRVPQLLGTGLAGDRACLWLEFLTLGSHGNSAALGHGLAALHRAPQKGYGWHRDNTLGHTPQRNTPQAHWPDFWRMQRLLPQLELAERNALDTRLLDAGFRLAADLDGFFRDYSPPPSLLHGDLWGGNHAYLADGTPVIFDPAVYCGDRECDLAMTELFGGFAADFYAAYREAWPLDPGYTERRTLYNLYHILNHANLFGGSYIAQASQMLTRLLACSRN
jgi:fructosamine-3-kinase